MERSYYRYLVGMEYKKQKCIGETAMSLHTKMYTLLYKMKLCSPEDYFKKIYLVSNGISYDKCNKIWENPNIKVHTNTSDGTIQQMADHIKKVMDLQPSDIVLDIGAGDGLIDEKLAKYVKTYYGFDFSKQKIEEAKKRNPNCKYWQQSFLEPINITDKVNKIFSFCVMQYCNPKDVESFLKKQKDVISVQEGRGIIVHFDVPDKNRAYNLYRNFDRDIVDKYKNQLETIFSDGSYWHDMEKVQKICKQYACDVEIKPSACSYRSDIIIHV